MFKYAWPAILWAAFIFYLSSLPSHSVPSFGLEFEDLAAHFVVFGILGYLLALAFMNQSDQRDKKRVAIVILIGILYGASDELHQMFVPGRFTSLSDFLADSFGVVAGVFAFLRFESVFRFIDERIYGRKRGSSG